MSRIHGRGDFEKKVYIGNLITHRPPDKKEIEYQFSYYGPLRNVWIARNPPGFGYIEWPGRGNPTKRRVPKFSE